MVPFWEGGHLIGVYRRVLNAILSSAAAAVCLLSSGCTYDETPSMTPLRSAKNGAKFSDPDNVVPESFDVEPLIKNRRQTQAQPPVSDAITGASSPIAAIERFPTGWVDILPKVRKRKLHGWTEYAWPPGRLESEEVSKGKPQQWQVNDKTNTLKCLARHHSYLATNEKYGNFILHIEFRYTETDNDKCNSGIMVRMAPHRRVMHQVELADTNASLIGGALENGVLTQFKTLVPGENGLWKLGFRHSPRRWNRLVEKRAPVPDPEPLPELGASKPVTKHPKGQWNTIEVTCQENTIIVWMNGAVTAYTDQCRVEQGPIGLESEGHPIEFRNLKIKPLE